MQHGVAGEAAGLLVLCALQLPAARGERSRQEKAVYRIEMAQWTDKRLASSSFARSSSLRQGRSVEGKGSMI